MFRSIKLFCVIAFVTLLGTGCVNVAKSNVKPTTNLAAIKTMYVRHYESDNTGVNEEIAQHLREKGVTVTTGSGPAPEGVDALVVYEDHWRWDITMYMLQLVVTIRDPNTEYLLASGESLHTSLTRKSQTEMVTEVIDNIYSGQALPNQAGAGTGPISTAPVVKSATAQQNAALQQKLKDLKTMLDNGTITQSEYDGKRKQLIDQM